MKTLYSIPIIFILVLGVYLTCTSAEIYTSVPDPSEKEYMVVQNEPGVSDIYILCWNRAGVPVMTIYTRDTETGVLSRSEPIPRRRVVNCYPVPAFSPDNDLSVWIRENNTKSVFTITNFGSRFEPEIFEKATPKTPKKRDPYPCIRTAGAMFEEVWLDKDQDIIHEPGLVIDDSGMHVIWAARETCNEQLYSINYCHIAPDMAVRSMILATTDAYIDSSPGILPDPAESDVFIYWSTVDPGQGYETHVTLGSPYTGFIPVTAISESLP